MRKLKKDIYMFLMKKAGGDGYITLEKQNERMRNELEVRIVFCRVSCQIYYFAWAGESTHISATVLRLSTSSSTASSPTISTQNFEAVIVSVLLGSSALESNEFCYAEVVVEGIAIEIGSVTNSAGANQNGDLFAKSYSSDVLGNTEVYVRLRSSSLSSESENCIITDIQLTGTWLGQNMTGRGISLVIKSDKRY